MCNIHMKFLRIFSGSIKIGTYYFRIFEKRKRFLQNKQKAPERVGYFEEETY